MVLGTQQHPIDQQLHALTAPPVEGLAHNRLVVVGLADAVVVEKPAHPLLLSQLSRIERERARDLSPLTGLALDHTDKDHTERVQRAGTDSRHGLLQGRARAIIHC